MRDERESVGEDPLDRLLNAAEWPEPEALRFARLQREWDRLARRRQRRRRTRLAFAAAAVFVATALGLWWISAGAPRDRLVAPAESDRRHAPAVAETNPRPVMALPETDSSNGDIRTDLKPGRAANAYELLVLCAKENRQKATRDDPLERAVQALVAEPDADIHRVVAPLMPRRAVHEDRLLRSIPNAVGEQLIAETRILAEIGGPRSVPRLAQLSGAQPTREIAVEGLRRLAEPAALSKLASAEPNEGIRRELLAILLDRGDPASLASFLDAVRDPRTAGSAIAAFEATAKPPVDSLVAYLNGPEADRRAAAAGLLGRSKRADSVARLIDLARNDSTRDAALMALLASDDPQARKFLVEAWNHPRMRSAVQLARLQWQVAAWMISVPEL